MKNNLQEFIDNITHYSHQHLCNVIISYRYLHLFADMAMEAMQELSRRRIAGDTFQYEDYIEQQLKELPNFKQLDQQPQEFWKNFNINNFITTYAKNK